MEHNSGKIVQTDEATFNGPYTWDGLKEWWENSGKPTQIFISGTGWGRIEGSMTPELGMQNVKPNGELIGLALGVMFYRFIDGGRYPSK